MSIILIDRIKINRLSNAKLADIHVTYGRSNGNSSLPQWLYLEAFHNVSILPRELLRVFINIFEIGSFKISATYRRVQRIIRSVNMEEEILERIEQDLTTTNTKNIGSKMGVLY